MTLFQITHLMEEQKTPEAKRAFLSGLHYAMSHIQAYSAELFLSDQHYNEVPAERLRTMAEDLMQVSMRLIKEAQAMERAEEEARHADMMSKMSPPPERSEAEKLRAQFEERMGKAPVECLICDSSDPATDCAVYLMNGNGGAYGSAPAHRKCVDKCVAEEPDNETRGWYLKTS